MSLLEMRKEIEEMKGSALRLIYLARGCPSVRRNAEVILAFLRILDFLTPVTEVPDGGSSEDKDSVP